MFIMSFRSDLTDLMDLMDLIDVHQFAVTLSGTLPTKCSWPF